MAGQINVVPLERIERAIILVRGEKVMLDSELAEIYGVETAPKNLQLRRGDICRSYGAHNFVWF